MNWITHICRSLSKISSDPLQPSHNSVSHTKAVRYIIMNQLVRYSWSNNQRAVKGHQDCRLALGSGRVQTPRCVQTWWPSTVVLANKGLSTKCKVMFSMWFKYLFYSMTWKSLYNFYVMCFSDFEFPSSPHQNETSTIIRDCWFYLEVSKRTQAVALGTSLSHWWKRAAHYSEQDACKLNATVLRHINNKDVNTL